MGNKSFVFRFSDVEVREREFSLLKAGKVLAVEPKAFRVLLLLLRNPQKVISKEELLNSVWGDTAVTEGFLTRCIWLLRRLLGDDVNEPRFIETVATVGYRLVCKVEVSEIASGDLQATDKTIGLREADSFATPANGEIAEATANPLARIDKLVFSPDQLIEEVPPTKAKRRPLYFGLAILGVAVTAAATLALWRAAFRTPIPPDSPAFHKADQRRSRQVRPDSYRRLANLFQRTVPLGTSALPVVLDLSRDGTELLVADSVLANEASIQFQVGNGMFAIEGFEPQALWVLPVAGGSPHRIGTILGADARFGSSTTGIIYAIGHDISSVSEDGSFSRKFFRSTTMRGAKRASCLPIFARRAGFSIYSV